MPEYFTKYKKSLQCAPQKTQQQIFYSTTKIKILSAGFSSLFVCTKIFVVLFLFVWVLKGRSVCSLTFF